jgi:hypothetical protein
MRWIIINGFAVCVLLFGHVAAADTIFTWTDADGVKRYSNSQPPDAAENVQSIEEIPYDQGADNRNRETYDRMVEDAGKSADQHFQRQAQEKAREAAAEQQARQNAETERIAAERARLQQEIEAIQGRALGPTFTQGMKDNQIQQIQDQIDRLESDAQ